MSIHKLTNRQNSLDALSSLESYSYVYYVVTCELR